MMARVLMRAVDAALEALPDGTPRYRAEAALVAAARATAGAGVDLHDVPAETTYRLGLVTGQTIAAAEEAAVAAVLPHYSAALDDLYRYRVAAAHGVEDVKQMLTFATLPKSVRSVLTEMLGRLTGQARGDVTASYQAATAESSAQRILEDAGAPPTLTRPAWEDRPDSDRQAVREARGQA